MGASLPHVRGFLQLRIVKCHDRLLGLRLALFLDRGFRGIR